MMTALFSLIVVTSILVVALRVAISEDMLLENIGFWAEDKIAKGHKIFKLLTCPFCAPSVMSIAGYFFCIVTGIVSYSSYKVALLYPLVVCGASILSGFSWSVLMLLDSKTEYYQRMPQDPNIEEESIEETTENYLKNK